MRTRTLILSLLAAFAISALAAGAAQAKPRWLCKGKVLAVATEKCAFLSENASDQEDGFVPKQLVIPGVLAIVCSRESDSGELVGGNPGTLANVTVKYTGCKVFSMEGTAESKPSRPPFVFNKELTACTAKGAGEPAGTITTKVLSGTLAYKPATGKTIVVAAFEPVTSPFVTIEISGGLCAVKETANVTGSVIGVVETPYEEKLVNPITFTYVPTISSGKLTACKQEPEEYETEGGAKVPDTLKWATLAACYYDEDWTTLETGGRFGVEP